MMQEKQIESETGVIDQVKSLLNQHYSSPHALQSP